MLDLSDLGLDPHTADSDTATHAAAGGALALVPGSTLARVLYELHTDTPAAVVKSPPGAGKTTLISEAVRWLMERTNWTVDVGTPTREGAIGVAARLAETAVDGDFDNDPIFSTHLDLRGLEREQIPRGVGGNMLPRNVSVTTLSSMEYSKSRQVVDLLIVDEAFQVTFAMLAMAAAHARKVLLVGDAGQIGPVVTSNTSSWEGLAEAPHRRAAEVFAAQKNMFVTSLPSTYRLSAETVDVIAPLYDFEFDSKWSPRYITSNGVQLPSICQVLIDEADQVSSMAHAEKVADIVGRYIGTEVSVPQPDGTAITSPVEPSSIAVVVAHNVQATGVESVLAARGLEKVKVGTADRLQGGQWHVVVAVDPMLGHDIPGSHQLHLGRLCVMLSRHMTHLVWAHDGNWRAYAELAEAGSSDATKGLGIRRKLVAKPDLDAVLPGGAP